MASSTWAEKISATDRLRHVDAEITARLAQRSGLPEPAVAAVGQHDEPLVPAPRRVRVFLRGAGDGGDFAQLTITHPVVPRPRSG